MVLFFLQCHQLAGQKKELFMNDLELSFFEQIRYLPSETFGDFFVFVLYDLLILINFLNSVRERCYTNTIIILNYCLQT